jgi:hypothetical protein
MTSPSKSGSGVLQTSRVSTLPPGFVEHQASRKAFATLIEAERGLRGNAPM